MAKYRLWETYSVWLGERLNSDLVIQSSNWESCLKYVRDMNKKSKTFHVYRGGNLIGIMKYKKKAWTYTYSGILQYYDSHNEFYVKKDGTLGKPIH